MSNEIDEIWQLFADDGGQSLDSVEETLLFLKENPTGEADVGALFRAMHTFKGNSRVLGLSVIESRAHLAEDLIGLVRDDGVPLGPELLELLLETVDALRGMLETTLASRRDADEGAASDLADRMRAMFRRCKDEPAPKAPAEPKAPDSTPHLQGEPESGSGGATAPLSADGIVFDPAPQSSFAEDPTYREIFSGMAREMLGEMRRAVAAFPSAPDAAQATLTREAERLRFAAARIGMREWRDALADFVALGEPSIAQAQSAIVGLTAMAARDFGADDSAPPSETPDDAAVSVPHNPIRVLFDALEPVLAAISAADERLSRGETVSGEELDRLVGKIKALSDPMDFVGLARAAEGFPPAHGDPTKFRRAKVRFYEELAAIVDSRAADPQSLPIRPLADLRGWCAEGASKILLDVRGTLDRMRSGAEAPEPGARVSDLLRLVFHACGHHQMDVAAQLSMALVDLFARAENGDVAADPVLQHIARSFVAAMELLFDAANAGGSPDMSAVEALFQEAATATFASSSHIEARLDLPKSFHNLLSPESVKTALAAMESGRRFYIVRADLNSSDELASAFLGWIGSGDATVISNVTVIQGDASLFDFLLASSLDNDGLGEAIARLDPGGKALRIEMTLSDRDANETKDAALSPAGKHDAEGDLAKGLPAHDAMSAVMLESIGAIVTGQAAVHHTLAELVEDELARAVELEMRRAKGDWGLAREPVCRYLAGLQEKIEKLAEAEAHVKGLLDRLQEEAIAVRTRSSALLLRPLAPLGEMLARQSGREVVITTSGDETQLDFSTLETLKEPLRALVAFAAQQSVETPECRLAAGKDRRGRVRVGLAKQDDQVIVTVEDDGRGIALAAIARRAEQLGWRAEANPLNMILREGFGPLANEEAAGRGTDFAEIHAALRARGGELRIAEPASGGMRAVVALPLAMALVDGMVVRVGKVTYVVPIDSIRRIVHSGVGDLMRISAAEGRYMLKLAPNDVLPVKFLIRSGEADGDEETDSLSLAFDAAQAAKAAASDGQDEQKRLFVVAGASSQGCALAVDELIGQEMVLVRPLQGHLAGIRGVTGCALLSGGRVGMVLDMSSVLDHPDDADRLPAPPAPAKAA
jgi:two-component system chemotaxis sensor kinase CheA